VARSLDEILNDDMVEFTDQSVNSWLHTCINTDMQIVAHKSRHLALQ